MVIPVAVFAHNEAPRIEGCLDSVRLAAPGREVRAFVLANGCTDETARVVERYAERNPWVRLVEIELGDKANAWNHFVHELDLPECTAVFMDGDVTAGAESFLWLESALAEAPSANAAAAVPATGRNRSSFTDLVVRDRGIAGNLYALPGHFLQRIRALGIRLPVGLIGDDSFLGALAKWDLDPRGTWDDSRIVPVLRAHFRFESLDPLSPRDIRVYWKRRIRYSLRYFQIVMLREILTTQGIEALPRSVEFLYRESVPQRLRWRGLDTLFDWIALRRIAAMRLRQESSCA